MPTYGYECKSCGHSFDAFQSIKDEPLKICPKCGKEVRRLINGGTGVIFKGGGFYATDKGGKSGITTKPAKTDEPAKSGSESAPCPGCAKQESCPKAANS
jgi:putative FmdB family regulatory protein